MPSGPWIQAGAALLFLAFLWVLLRFALGLRYAKVVREEAREAVDGNVVVEIPSAEGEVGFFVDEPGAFAWPGGRVAKADVAGVRLLLRGSVVGEHARTGRALPPAGRVDEFDGRERWDVVLYLADGSTTTIACGTLREGVSRDVATRIFEAVRCADESLGGSSSSRS